MRIGIDGYNLALPNGTGVATYGYTLASVLKASDFDVEGVFGIDAGKDAALREILFFETLGKSPVERSLEQRRQDKRALRRRALNPFASPRLDDVPLSGRVVTQPLADRLPAFDRIMSAPRLFDLAHCHFAYYGRLLPIRMSTPPPIMHWTYPIPIRLVGARNIYTLHDLVPLRLPYTTTDPKRRYRHLISRIAATADHLCTVSEASRNDILTEFGMNPGDISNTYQAAIMPPGTLARTVAEDAAVIENIFGLPHRGYFLFFGAIEPKKNVGRLIEAYLSLGLSTPLVIVGGRGWQNEGELALLGTAAGTSDEEDQIGSVNARDPSRRVIRLTHLSRSLLLKLIRSARAALFPSISEGFGLPILEAMQLGTPVLTSNISAMPELAGDAAVLVDPYDTFAIAQNIAHLDTDRSLRERLSRAGPLRAEHFSPERYSTRLRTMYSEVMAAPLR
ncbi:glycosyltransferase family 1 protein [Sphingomonas sp. BIUV-7]|uniref:Glycosyltransferase family 1 protein n=1 Tax=Sphingomonas natans TaxID=3063330 RepID=A0ABT8Y7G4_9SPHN|nr:glycosyltransferase family 1 protein [Sphingomonas sp. BIUV-7]MDO6413684.1 glycosyltransferase family 1 protein [Sphingomonas sp. BIUV-7]